MTGADVSGAYIIDPDGPEGEPPVTAYCDMTTAGGGWTLLSWTGSNAVGARGGLPYPGLAQCPTFDCVRGSALRSEPIEALFDHS